MRIPATALMCVVALAAPVLAGDRPDKETRPERPTLFTRIYDLLPPAYERELDLTAEQKEQIEALDAEFKKKRRELLTMSALKVMTIINDVMEDARMESPREEDAPVLAVLHEVTGGLLEMRRTRCGFEKKMRAILTPEQQQTLLDLKDQPLLPRPLLRIRTDRSLPRNALMMCPEIQGRMNLSREQIEQLRDIEKEMCRQIEAVLTAEQKKQLESSVRQRRHKNAEKKGADKE